MPITAYFILTFVLSWSGVIVMSFFMGMPTTSQQFADIGPIALLPFLFGPTLIGLFMTGIVHGAPGFRQLKSRLFKWRIGPEWYAFVLLAVPVALAVILFVLSRFSGDFVPKVMTASDRTSLIVTGALTGLIGGGFLEELGWTGFATPAFRARNFSILKTGLIIGFFWGLWHFLPVFWGSGDSQGHLDWDLFYPGLFSHYAVLIPYRIILVWIHERTGSLIPVMLMHASLTAFLLFILNISAGGVPLLIYLAVVAILLWLFVALILAMPRRAARG